MAERKTRLVQLKTDLDTCCKTIPSGSAKDETENVVSWGRNYALVRVRVDTGSVEI
jgi:hypothetical protein